VCSLQPNRVCKQVPLPVLAEVPIPAVSKGSFKGLLKSLKLGKLKALKGAKAAKGIWKRSTESEELQEEAVEDQLAKRRALEELGIQVDEELAALTEESRKVCCKVSLKNLI